MDIGIRLLLNVRTFNVQRSTFQRATAPALLLNVRTFNVQRSTFQRATAPAIAMSTSTDPLTGCTQ
jgi:hypothetical protein